MHGVVIKGVPFPMPASDSLPLAVSIPKGLAQASGLKNGDRMLTYFIGEDVKVRQFNVAEIHDAIAETDDRHVVYVSLPDMQRLNGWSENEVSAMEILLEPSYKNEESILAMSQQIGFAVNAYSEDSEAPVVATSSVSRYPQLFDWLSLIDFNVLFILILMTIVAGFNMISGLLIMLFENISTIGLLKALGMTDRKISKVFLSSAAVLVFKGMLIGNSIAFAFCLLQSRTHFLKLDPENYFVSYVPINIDAGSVILADILSFAVIMLLLLIPTLFISRVDPAQTVRMK
jgi:lipoprotein-releasing system permease protein